MFRTIIGDLVISVTNCSCLTHSQSICYQIPSFYDTILHDTLQHNSAQHKTWFSIMLRVYQCIHPSFCPRYIYYGFHGIHLVWNVYIHFARMFFLLSYVWIVLRALLSLSRMVPTQGPTCRCGYLIKEKLFLAHYQKYKSLIWNWFR